MTNFFKVFLTYFTIIFVIIIFSFFPLLQNSNYNLTSPLNGIFIWPLPENTYISSYFGKRTSPTAGASSYHSGIDIPATEGTLIYSVCDGIVSFASWGAGGGYTVVVQNDDISVSYCHVSPIFLVSYQDRVEARTSYCNSWT